MIMRRVVATLVVGMTALVRATEVLTRSTLPGSALGALEDGGGCGNLRPVIGVLTQPQRTPLGVEVEYVAASYVKFLEAAGARVVPLRYSASEEELRRVFDSINGVLFPGGAADLEPGHVFFDSSDKLYRWTLAANAAGEHFPMWGTCLGFEQLLVLASGDNATVLHSSGSFDSEDMPAPIELTAAGPASAMLSSLGPKLLKALTSEDVAYNSHGQGVTPEAFSGNAKLSSIFESLATGVDRKGKRFVAAVEAKQGLPIFGVQFHPEKAQFEFHVPTQIPHSLEAVGISQALANFFVGHTRCNDRRFAGGYEATAKELIQASCGHHIVQTNSYFSEIYTFLL